MLDQIDYLKGRGFLCFVVLPSFGPICESLLEREVPFKVTPNPWWTEHSFADKGFNRIRTLEAARKIAKCCTEWSVDIIYTQTIVAPAGALAAAMLGKAHVWHIHEFSYNPENIVMVVQQPSLSNLLRSTSNLVVFNSLAVASEWSGWLPNIETLVVYNWTKKTIPLIDATAPNDQYSTGPCTITMVASVIPWKRQMDAVRAVANLVAEGIDVRLSLIGPQLHARYCSEITSFIDNNGLQDHVKLVGYIEDPTYLVKSAQIAVVCSRLEPFGRGTVESMMCGVPVVGANSGGTSEIIQDGISGLLYEVGDVDDLTYQLRRLIGDRNLRTALAAGGVERAIHFSSAEDEMAPLVDRIVLLRDQHNPSWPMRSILAACLFDDLKLIPAKAIRRVKYLLGRLRRRVYKPSL